VVARGCHGSGSVGLTRANCKFHAFSENILTKTELRILYLAFFMNGLALQIAQFVLPLMMGNLFGQSSVFVSSFTCGLIWI
jgi:hypothetical protein